MSFVDWGISFLSILNTFFFIGSVRQRRFIKANWKAADERRFRLRMAAQLSRRP